MDPTKEPPERLSVGAKGVRDLGKNPESSPPEVGGVSTPVRGGKTPPNKEDKAIQGLFSTDLLRTWP